MTAKPDHHSDAEAWPGGWINFYYYRGGQRHYGSVISATREEADAVRAAWFAASAEYAKQGVVLAFYLPTEESFKMLADFDQLPDDNPLVAKVKNCNFSIAVPYERP